MRITCNVSIGNRLLPPLAINSHRKYVKSTLALCRKTNGPDYCIILFTTSLKSGTKYELKDNLQAVLTKFLKEGKATIQFKEPPHDMFIQCDRILLTSFFHLLHKAVIKKPAPNRLPFSSMGVTGISRNVAPTRLFISKRQEYPRQGLPRTLEVLSITGVNRFSLDNAILRLQKLRILDISQNTIEWLPEELSQMHCLSELNISSNQLGKAAPNQWNWMGGNLSKTLRLLNLGSNKLKYLPDQIVKLHSLITLLIDGNRLKTLPSGIGNLKNLRILSACNNSLSVLPGSVKKWQLQSIDLAGNNFNTDQQHNPAAIFPKPLPVASLKEYAARKVLHARVPYTSEDLPRTVMNFLDLAKYCVCGKACFDVYIRHQHMLYLSSIAHNLSLSYDGVMYVPIDCYFCSLKCFSSANYNRNRNPVI